MAVKATATIELHKVTVTASVLPDIVKGQNYTADISECVTVPVGTPGRGDIGGEGGRDEWNEPLLPHPLFRT